MLVGGVALVTGSRGARAEGVEGDKAATNERCAVRIAIALQGKSADAALLANADPQTAIDGMLASPEFADRYARFINSEFNGGPSTAATDDMLTGAFRILANTTGLELNASVGNPGEDRTATGRSASACKGCHFDEWYALDKFARLLPKKTGQGDAVTFTAPTEGPQQLLGKTLATDKDLISSLVDSDAWRFSQCHNVFKFLYGRGENQCEAKVFDACVDALVSQKTIQSAVAAVAKDPSFCVK